VPCGIAGSITAARAGAKVVLVEPMKHGGGLSPGQPEKCEHLNGTPEF
jgi:thioredoxin reductase